MPQSLAYNYIHLVFSTKYREDLILYSVEQQLYAHIAGICSRLDSHALAIGGMPDHIHILLSLSKKQALVKLVQEIKKISSLWMKEQPDIQPDFYWQNGYGAFSVSPRHIERVKRYIANQKKHHASATFQEEYIGFLKEYTANYDERYLWD